MRIFCVLIVTVISVAALSVASDDPVPVYHYVWPLGIRTDVTSVPFDPRNGHPHGGLDISLNGRVGSVPVVSIDDGRLLRLRIAQYGYGKALYVRHADGRVSVYGHLDGFSDRIESLAARLQRETGRWNLDYWFDDWEPPVRVKKGETIALGGKTGTRTPHLHFELRSNESDVINPLTNGLTAPDTEAPTIRALALVPADERSTVDGSTRPLVIDLSKPPDTPPVVIGRVGVAALADDAFRSGGKRFSPYRLELAADGKPVFAARHEAFSYFEPSVADTAVDVIGRDRYLRVYNPYPVPLPHFSAIDAGTTADLSPGAHHLTVTALDAAGQKDSASIDVVVNQSEDPAWRPWPREGDDVLIPDQGLRSSDGLFSLSALDRALYTPMRVQIDPVPMAPDGALTCYRAQAGGFDSRRGPEVGFRKPDKSMPTARLSIVLLGTGYLDHRWNPASGRMEARTDSLGTFCLMRDETAPSLSVDVAPKKRRTPGSVAVRFRDENCGVDLDSVQVRVDGKQVMVDVSERHGSAVIVPQNGIDPGPRKVDATASDHCGNAAVESFDVTFP